MLYINAKPGDKLNLGRKGENSARTILFDISQWRKLYGDGVVALLHQRAGDSDPYPCAISVDGNTAAWEITSADTAVASQYGKYELQYRVNDQLAKSATGVASVYESLGPATETPPAPQQGWVDKVLQAGADAEDAAKRAEEALTKQPYPNAETRTWWVWDATTGNYKDSGEPYVGSGEGDGEGGSFIETDETLTIKDGVLSVNTAKDAEADNTLPITSAAVYAELGNIDVLLKTI